MNLLDKISSAFSADAQEHREDAAAVREIEDLETDGQHTLAWQHAAKLLEVQPRWAPALVVRGCLALRRGDTEESLLRLSQAVDSDAKSADAWLHLSAAQIASGLNEQAATSLAKLAQLVPRDSQTAAQALAHRSRLSLRSGHVSAAVALARRAHQLAPEATPVVESLARALCAAQEADADKWLWAAARAPHASMRVVLEAVSLQTDLNEALTLTEARLSGAAELADKWAVYLLRVCRVRLLIDCKRSEEAARELSALQSELKPESTGRLTRMSTQQTGSGPVSARVQKRSETPLLRLLRWTEAELHKAHGRYGQALVLRMGLQPEDGEKTKANSQAAERSSVAAAGAKPLERSMGRSIGPSFGRAWESIPEDRADTRDDGETNRAASSGLEDQLFEELVGVRGVLAEPAWVAADLVPLALGSGQLSVVDDLLEASACLASPNGPTVGGAALAALSRWRTSQISKTAADDLYQLLLCAPNDQAVRLVVGPQSAQAHHLESGCDEAASARQSSNEPAQKLLKALESLSQQLAMPGPYSDLGSTARRLVERQKRPLRVAVVGEFNAGKSSLVNALVPGAATPVGVTPVTAVQSELRFGTAAGRVIDGTEGVRELSARATAAYLESLAGQDAKHLRSVEIFSPNPLLKNMDLVDTPGLNATAVSHAAQALAALEEAEAIIWVFAAGQAGKATERDSLAVVRESGKPIIAVINKLDLVEPEDRESLVAHVATQFAGAFAAVVAVSARAMGLSRAADSQSLSDAVGPSGSETLEPEARALVQAGRIQFAELSAALREHFFDRARGIKFASAVAQAQTLLACAARKANEVQADQPAQAQGLQQAQGIQHGQGQAEATENKTGNAARSAREHLDRNLPPLGRVDPDESADGTKGANGTNGNKVTKIQLHDGAVISQDTDRMTDLWRAAFGPEIGLPAQPSLISPPTAQSHAEVASRLSRRDAAAPPFGSSSGSPSESTLEGAERTSSEHESIRMGDLARARTQLTRYLETACAKEAEVLATLPREVVNVALVLDALGRAVDQAVEETLTALTRQIDLASSTAQALSVAVTETPVVPVVPASGSAVSTSGSDPAGASKHSSQPRVELPAQPEALFIAAVNEMRESYADYCRGYLGACASGDVADRIHALNSSRDRAYKTAWQRLLQQSVPPTESVLFAPLVERFSRLERRIEMEEARARHLEHNLRVAFSKLHSEPLSGLQSVFARLRTPSGST